MQTYENIGVYDRHFNECRLLFFVTYQGAIRAINDTTKLLHMHMSLYKVYIP